MEEEELLATVAQDIAAGKIVGWFQGRSELGPRALGNRSILADPRDEAMKDRINARVKHREPFSSLRSRHSSRAGGGVFRDRADRSLYDDGPESAPREGRAHSGWNPCRWNSSNPDRGSRLEPAFLCVIEKFAKLTGVPVVLNTSFNLLEPIVQSPENAISCFLRTQMDVLVVGDFYVTDRRYPSHKP